VGEIENDRRTLQQLVIIQWMDSCYRKKKNKNSGKTVFPEEYSWAYMLSFWFQSSRLSPPFSRRYGR